MKIKACLTSNNDYWKTPISIYKKFLDLGYFDVCPENPTFNGLEIEWKTKNYCNPPYSQIKKWVEKSVEEYKKGKFVVLLIPSRTDTKWFKLLYENNASFIFIQGRLKFNDGKNSAPFPSMVVQLNNINKRPLFNITDKELSNFMEVKKIERSEQEINKD